MGLIDYQKRYRIRRAVSKDVDRLEVTFPYEVIDRKARELGLSVDDFLSSYSAVAEYDDDVVRYTLELTPPK